MVVAVQLQQQQAEEEMQVVAVVGQGLTCVSVLRLRGMFLLVVCMR